MKQAGRFSRGLFMGHLMPLLLFGVVAGFTPGPNNLMLLNSGLMFGIRRSLAHWFGVVIGFSIMVFICVLGAGATVTNHVWVQTALKFAGSGYMLYLAYKMIRNSQALECKQEARPMTFIQAALFQWLNPKAWMMLIGAIGIFMTGKNYVTEAFSLTSVFFIMTILGGAIWLWFGVSLQRFLTQDKHKNVFNYVMAALLVMSVALIFVE